MANPTGWVVSLQIGGLAQNCNRFAQHLAPSSGGGSLRPSVLYIQEDNFLTAIVGHLCWSQEKGSPLYPNHLSFLVQGFGAGLFWGGSGSGSGSW